MTTLATATRFSLKKFKPDVPNRLLTKLVFQELVIKAPLYWNPNLIETLSIAKPMGKGRTNLTLIRPDIVQTDPSSTTPVPFAAFDLTTGQREPAVSFHFQPSAYGITTISDYVATFYVECFGPCEFSLAGFAGAGSIANPGAKFASGKVGIKTVIKNLPPNQNMNAAITQKAGKQWSFFEVEIQYPSLTVKKL